MNNADKHLNELDKVLGGKSEVEPKKSVKLLDKISKSLELQKTDDVKANIDIKKKLDNLYKIKELIEKQNDDAGTINKSVLKLKEVVDKIFKKNLDDEKTIKAIIKLLNEFEFPTEIKVNNFPKEIKVNNLPKTTEISNFPKEIKVNNQLKEIEVSNFPTDIKISNHKEQIKVSNFPKDIEIKKPKWFKQFKPLELVNDLKSFFTESFEKIVTKITGTEYKANIDKYKNEKHAIAVKLVDKDGKILKDLTPNIVVNPPGCSSPDNVGLKNTSEDRINPATLEKQNAIINAINNPTTSPSIATAMEGQGIITVGTTPIELVFTGVTKTILISALPANSGLLYSGNSDIASNGDNAVTFAEAGTIMKFDYNDIDNPVYIVGSEAGQQFVLGAFL